jgi:hypothetical protein
LMTETTYIGHSCHENSTEDCAGQRKPVAAAPVRDLW